LRSIVTVVDGAHVAISKLKIAGPPTPSCASPSDLDTGILVGENATLDLESAAVTNIRDVPARCVSPQTKAVAVAVGVSGTLAASPRNPNPGVPTEGYASPGHATIRADLISGYGEEGINVAGSGSTASIIGSHINGIESSSTQVVHGLLVQFGGTATVVGNTITGNRCPSSGAIASSRGGRSCGPAFDQVHDKGIAVSVTGPGTIITDNKLSDNDVGIALVKAPSCCTISHNLLVDNRYFGDLIWDSNGSVNNDIISGGRVGVGVVAQSDNAALALHGVSITKTSVATTKTYSCCGHHATVVR
jgi:parallel beta-helix repeat protein